MKLIKQKNKWSCTLTSLAMLLNLPIESITNFLGHDGSEIIFLGLSDPMRRKGVTIQECIDIVMMFGYGLIPIEACPVQTPDGLHEYELPCAEERFYGYLENNEGLIIGKVKNHWHTCAWDGYNVYDPCGDIYSIDKCKLEIQTFWLLTN
jgi:hypothetical protein